MAVKRMMAATSGAMEWGGSDFTASWTIELEPHHWFAQVTLADFWQTDDQSTAQVAITKLTHRKPNGKDQTVHFASNFLLTESGDMTRTASDPRMSSITVSLNVSDVYATWMLQLFSFD